MATAGTKNRGVAALLAFLLGGLGVHRFYLGQWWGIFYLLLVWTLLPCVVAVIEAIVFLCTSNEKWDARHNGGKDSGGVSSTILVVAVVAGALGLFFFVAIIGIMAAIAIPAYQDYTRRAQIAMAIGELSSHKAQFEALVQKRDLSKPLGEAGIAVRATPQTYLSGAYYDPEKLVLVGKLAGGSAGRSIGLMLGKDGRWSCGSVDLEKKYLPSACRADMTYASEEEAAKLRAAPK